MSSLKKCLSPCWLGSWENIKVPMFHIPFQKIRKCFSLLLILLAWAAWWAAACHCSHCQCWQSPLEQWPGKSRDHSYHTWRQLLTRTWIKGWRLILFLMGFFLCSSPLSLWSTHCTELIFASPHQKRPALEASKDIVKHLSTSPVNSFEVRRYI